ncbi:hypothetical protein SAMN02800692_2603 [Luteibacter sp. UNC138MFCol5.1]|uniref:hypothetical protein n=1 Tax=Luteibacter sp. UNC138MFCol5.1 TaxID=1502774 RepID=UPI0008B144AF|nr:hypothetical protein [Luteibacter sp. UNC138MFCol5.1]SEO89675.1 hypothetical protein SAMN02800692_2603 [Luteibacter sp. UNC138MFCol5.1]
MSEERPHDGHWKRLRRTFRDRTLLPLKSPSFLLFAAIVVITAGLGIWVELYRAMDATEWKTESLRLAVNVFYPSLGCAAAAQLIFNETVPKFLRGFGLLMTIIFAACCVAFGNATSTSAIVAQIVLSNAALWVWWIANAENTEIFDEPIPPATGPADAAAAELPGTLSGLKTK